MNCLKTTDNINTETMRKIKQLMRSETENMQTVVNNVHALPFKYLNPEFSMLDLFSGCGGLSLGFEIAGFYPLLFSEVNLNAAQTYLINRTQQNITPIGDIYTLTEENIRLLQEYWKINSIDDIDIVCGGPPCQGYSGIGHRRTFKLEKADIPSNQLYHEMVRVIKQIRPKVFLFENVKGLLSGRWTKNGEKGEIFADVLSTFQAIEGYHCEWDLLHAKNYGVPQNRPRVMIVGYRSDLIQQTEQPQLAIDVIAEPSSPYAQGGHALRKGYLPNLYVAAPHLEELLADLVDPNFSGRGNTASYPQSATHEIQKWLRLPPPHSNTHKVHLTEQEYSAHSPKVVEKFSYMLQNSGQIPEHLRTKKFSQRVLPRHWSESGPNITATSLPDDYVHFCQPRIPTVREWARIQTFPDWYQFAGPRTTGGRRRAGDPDAGVWDREVPKYTQIGNAVPVLLAYYVAQHIGKILRTGRFNE